MSGLSANRPNQGSQTPYGCQCSNDMASFYNKFVIVFRCFELCGISSFPCQLISIWMFPVGLGFVIGFFILLLYWASPLIQNWKMVLLTFCLVVRFGISYESYCLIVFQSTCKLTWIIIVMYVL